MEQVEDKSPMEIAMEYIADHPELTSVLDDVAFQAFWDYPVECIKQHEGTLNMLRTSFGFTEEQIVECCKDYLSDACKYVSDLKAKELLNQ